MSPTVRYAVAVGAIVRDDTGKIPVTLNFFRATLVTNYGPSSTRTISRNRNKLLPESLDNIIDEFIQRLFKIARRNPSEVAQICLVPDHVELFHLCPLRTEHKQLIVATPVDLANVADSVALPCCSINR